MRRLAGCVAIVLVLVLIAAACGSDDDNNDTTATTKAGSSSSTTSASSAWDEVVAKAKQEGSVTLYHAKTEENAKAILDAFEKKYGIKGTQVRGSDGPNEQRLNQELAAGKVQGDVVLLGDPIYPKQFADKGQLFEATGPAADAYSKDDLAVKGGKGVVLVGHTPTAFIYNTNTVKPAPKDWDDLIGKTNLRVGVYDPHLTPNYVALYDLLIKLKGEDYLKGLSQQHPQIAQTSITLAQSIAAGELDWTPLGFQYNINIFAGQNAPIGYVYPKSGTFMFTQVGFVLKQTAHPNAGRLLLDFIMSPEGQAILNGNNEGLSPLKSVPGTIQMPSDVKLIPVDLSIYTDNDLNRIRNLWDGLFKK